MKKWAITTFLLLFFLPSFAQTVREDGTEVPGAPLFKWVEESHDFGKVPQGIPVTTRFYFTNTGSADLIIENVKPTCSCISPYWTRKEVKPGEQGFAELTYNAASHGIFNKTIVVISNANPPQMMLYLTGEVLKKEEEDLYDKGMLNQSEAPAPQH